MKFVKVKNQLNNEVINLHYEEFGSGNPVIFIHGWPLNHDMWEYQLATLPKHNIRCIAYDRRGFGKSDRPWGNYDYDTLADDLKAVIDQLDLKEVTLVGFSMGGGEIARYIGKHGTKNIKKIALISSVTPFMLQAKDNTDGVPKEKFDEMIFALEKDRPAFLADFGKSFYGYTQQNEAVSQALLDWNQTQCLTSMAKACTDCARSFSETDFRDDLKKIDIPTLIIHGDMDMTVPIKVSGDKTAELLPNAKYIIYKDAAHGLFITEKEKLNNDLLSFIADGI